MLSRLDYFRFNVEKPGFVVLDFAHEPINGAEDKQGWNYSILDDNGELLYSGVSDLSDDVSASPVIGLDIGTYYVLIDSEDLYHDSEKYYLTLNFTESGEWETEFNNSFTKADTLEMGKTVFGLLSDLGTDYDFDYYTFTLTNETDIDVTFSHEVLSYSRDIFAFTVYNENMEPVANYNDGGTTVKVSSDAESVTASYKTLQPGKYYIKVATGLYYDRIKYSICVK